MNMGCNNHMYGSKSSFSRINKVFCKTVVFGDNSIVNVMRKSDIQINNKDGNIETISNTFYDPDLKTNIC